MRKDDFQGTVRFAFARAHVLRPRMFNILQWAFADFVQFCIADCERRAHASIANVFGCVCATSASHGEQQLHVLVELLRRHAI